MRWKPLGSTWVVAGAPELARTIGASQADWSDLSAACLPLLQRYEISRRLWDDAQDRIGRRMATAIFAIMVAHGRDHYQSPGGCFRRMVERHERGELNLLPSYFGLTSVSPAIAAENTVTAGPGHISQALARWKLQR